MISRNDLVKEFELVTKQEIINHNSIISDTNKAIAELNSRCDVLRNSFGNKVAYLTVDKEKVAAILIKLKDSIDGAETNIRKQASSHTKAISDVTNKIAEINTMLSSICDFNESALSKFKELFLKYDALSRKLDEEKSNWIREKVTIISYIEQRFLDFVKTLEDRPSQANLFKEEICKRLDVDRIDFQGLMREIQVLKKEMFVIQKNIENLYTEIQKLVQQ